MLITSFFSLALLGTSPAQAGNGVDHYVIPVQLDAAATPGPKFDAARCRGIADLSSKAQPMFQQKENGEWECSYLLDYTETGHTPSVFIQIRGVEPGRWSSFRLKLNFGSILSRQALGGRAASIVYTLIGDQTPLRELGVTLAGGRDFELLFNGMSLKYKQERFDKTRFNLSGTNAPNPNKETTEQ
ncbi:DUF6030 family protein [Agrobacterium larrymoorei]|uniref:Uncharacterized protein n=1 Tax=Agrobacterium larrymoorei TaxID=160699 RepID=A0A4D7DSE9_9HYPH|nr:DUF6030 family protein [Agrobacterium larrymoorei]QCI99378.1 hypothetical protein CFBP5473_15290 [Agrobacterium larrymoorei]QYA08920.1 hypothetical protein J5285_16035 [Agrobacterium larrymoorei]